jgi:L-fuculose-phosphate aldolase
MPGEQEVRDTGAANGKLSAEQAARAQLVACGRDLLARGLLSQTSGNLSIRMPGDQVLITPSSMEYDLIEPPDIVLIRLDGSVVSGDRKPSSETPLHCLVYTERPDITAIVHTHSPYATTLAVLGLPIPAVHYMIAIAGTNEIAVADYATFGTPELARNVRDAFPAPARAALMANHGLIAGGRSLKDAASVAEAVENIAGLYYRALAVGTPMVLSDSQMADVLNRHRPRKPQQPG